MLHFARPQTNDDRPLARYFRSSHRLEDNSEERILTLMSRAGFVSCEKVTEGAMFFALLRIASYRAA